MRFPEFGGNWTETTIGEQFDLYSGNTPSRLNKDSFKGIINWITSGELKDHYIYTTIEKISENAAKDNNLRVLPVGTFVIAIYGLEAQGVRGTGSITQQPSTISQACMAFIPKGQVTNEFVYSWYKKHGNTIGIRYAQGTKQQNLSYDLVSHFKISYPEQTNEQEKLVRFIRIIDDRISTQIRIIEEQESLIIGYLQRISTKGKANGTWKDTFLRDVLTERKETNTSLHPVYSVSVSQGVINQIEYLGRSFAAKDTSNYHVAHKGDIIYTKSPTGSFPYGIIKQSFVNEPVAISPLYGVYTPVNYYIGNILHFFFLTPNHAQNYLHPLIQKGAKNTINITNEHFLDNKVLLPLNETETIKCAKFLNVLLEKISIEKKLLVSFQQQKKYLLSQMFI